MSTGTESIITPDGHRRILNLEPSDPKKVARYASAAPPLEIPLSEIQPFNAWPSQIAIKDQDGAGACNGHAAATAMELSRFMQGMPHVPLSAWWVYGKLVKGWDRGSNIMDALELCQADGVAPESEVKYGDYSGRYTDQAASAAKRFKLKIGRQLKTWEEIVTAVALRRGVNLAVRATMGWQSGNLDADGCPPVGRGPANHAVAVGGAVKKLQNGELAILDPNSWGTRWGQKGFCWLKRAHIESASWFEAYEVVAVSDDPTDPTPPAP